MSEPTPPRCEHHLVVGRLGAPSATPMLWLERAFDLALLLAPLHHAIQFRLGLWRIERSWEVRAFLPHFLRRLLDGLPSRRGPVSSDYSKGTP
jgi:hypothetical protein